MIGRKRENGDLSPAAVRGDLQSLPNGMLVACPSADLALDLYERIFEQRIYCRNGITIDDSQVVFDVGAHIGMFTLFALAFGKGAKVLAFEPIPSTFEFLQRTLQANHLKAELFSQGLGEREEAGAVFTSYPGLSPLSTRYRIDRDELREFTRRWLQYRRGNRRISEEVIERYFMAEVMERCRVSTVSSVIRERRVERIDLLKVNAQGDEGSILRGIASGDWAKIRQLVVQAHSRDLEEEVCTILERQGYTIQIASRNKNVNFSSPCSSFSDIYARRCLAVSLPRPNPLN